MTTARAARLDRWLPVVAALLIGAVLVASGWSRAMALGFGDGDDALRLVQVRDLLAGQGWFDTTQYRINAPTGGLMHWSRLIDAQLAGAIALLDPLLGRALTERVVLALYPPLLLLPLLLLLAAAARRLDTDRWTLAATMALAALGFGFLHYFVPLRIDHHNWQAILSLALLVLALGPATARNGALAGGVAALHLAISLEALPYLLLFGAIFAWRWLWSGADRARLAAFVATVALAAPLILLLTRGGSGVATAWCDAWSRPYLLATVAAAAVLLGGMRMPVMARSMAARAALLALAGATGLAALAADAPQCLSGPFAALDPLVRDYWYRNVLEGQPLWRHGVDQAAALLAPVLAALGAAWWMRGAAQDGAARARWTMMAAVLACVAVLALLVARTAAVAHIYATPVLAAAIVRLLRQSRVKPTALSRVAALLPVMVLIPPVTASLAMAAAQPWVRTPAPAGAMVAQCPTPADLRRIDVAGSPALVLTGLDVAPMVLVHTPHRVLATGHHRNGAAMHDLIALLAATPDRARTMAAAKQARWLLLCPDLPEIGNIARDFPHGLAAAVRAGKTPAWLTPVALAPGSRARLYRITPE